MITIQKIGNKFGVFVEGSYVPQEQIAIVKSFARAMGYVLLALDQESHCKDGMIQFKGFSDHELLSLAKDIFRASN